MIESLKGIFSVVSLLSWVILGSQAEHPVDVGDKAPSFKLPGSDGNEYQLADFVGKTPLVIAWFPKAFTGG